jgi:hypothetical protein
VLTLLVAECSPRFRAVFSFGPVQDPVTAYKGRFTPAVNMRDQREIDLRAPIKWLDSISTPTFVLEGDRGSASELQSIARTSKNPKIQFFLVPRADHFSILAPANQLVAQKILADTGDKLNIAFTQDELNRLLGN